MHRPEYEFWLKKYVLDGFSLGFECYNAIVVRAAWRVVKRSEEGWLGK